MQTKMEEKIIKKYVVNNAFDVSNVQCANV